MKKFLLLSLIFSKCCSFGATVLWNGLSLSSTGTPGAPIQYMTLSWSGLQNGEYGPALYPVIYFSAIRTDSCLTLKNDPIILLAYGDNWVRLSEGDVVDADSTRHADAYFFRGLDATSEDYDYEADLWRVSDYDIVLPLQGTDTFYFGFVTANDFWDGSADSPEVCFGWAELAVSNGNLLVVRSALDVSGEPLVVGQVPEPAAGALAALGALALLRRRRPAAKMTEPAR